MAFDYNYCRLMLERVTDAVDGVADVRAYDDPKSNFYQIGSTFKYPLGVKLEIDEYFNAIKDLLGAEWSLKLSVEPSGEGITIARITARFRYERTLTQ